MDKDTLIPVDPSRELLGELARWITGWRKGDSPDPLVDCENWLLGGDWPEPTTAGEIRREWENLCDA